MKVKKYVIVDNGNMLTMMRIDNINNKCIFKSMRSHQSETYVFMSFASIFYLWVSRKYGTCEKSSCIACDLGDKGNTKSSQTNLPLSFKPKLLTQLELPSGIGNNIKLF